MNGPESELNKKLLKRIKAIWPRLRPVWERVENRVGNGTFDTFMGAEWGSGWIELKFGGPNAMPEMRPGQPGFGERMLRAGIPAHVLMGHPDGTVKLLKGNTTGKNWRECVVMRANLGNNEQMRQVFMACTSPKLL